MHLAEAVLIPMSSNKQRGQAVQIRNLPKPLRVKFARASSLSGMSQSQAAIFIARRFVREAEEKFGDLFNSPTPAESDVVSAVRSGAAESQLIAEETGIPLLRLTNKQKRGILDDMVSRGILVTRKKGGKTEGARGAVIDLYFVSPKYDAGK